MSHDVFDYPCFDFVLRSSIALPELRGQGSEDRDRPVVRIHWETCADGVAAASGFEVHGDVATLTIPGVARYRISAGTDIFVCPSCDASQRQVRLFLLGSALGIAALQRGLLLLHANAVVFAGAAHAFAGHSGAGKSTLAAYFQQAGYPVLCDDVCAVTFDDAGAPLAWPGLPRLKLWRDAAEQLGHDPATLDAVIDGTEKYQVPFDRAPIVHPVPLASLSVLGWATEDAAAVARLRGVAAMTALMEHSYRYEYVAPLGLTARHFAHCAALIARVKLYQASRARGFEVFAREAGRLQAQVMRAEETSPIHH